MPDEVTPGQREGLLVDTFVELADSLVEDFDIIDLLTVLADRCVALGLSQAAGILLVDGEGSLRVMAASSHKAWLLELFQLQNEEGPCREAFTSGAPVFDGDLASAAGRWPLFAPEAVGLGFQSVYSVPLRLRSLIIGALALFGVDAVPLEGSSARVVAALADVASIAILQDQALRESEVRAGHLQYALDSRVIIEQAKGMLAERGGTEMDQAFRSLRSYARGVRRHLTTVAQELVGGTLALETVLDAKDGASRIHADPSSPGA